MADRIENIRQLTPTHRFVHRPGSPYIKYQTRRPDKDWSTRANIRVRHARELGDFAEEVQFDG